VLFGLAPAALGQLPAADVYSAGWLYQQCIEEVKQQEGRPFDPGKATACAAYVHGLRYGFASSNTLWTRISGNELVAVSRAAFGCPDEPLDNQATIRLFVEGMRQDRSLSGKPIIESFRVIFSRWFPCNS
jgi:hypothetical protein